MYADSSLQYIQVSVQHDLHNLCEEKALEPVLKLGIDRSVGLLQHIIVIQRSTRQYFN